ncbi:MAG: DnaJ domain-containing protein, partial [Nitrosotalea sp.]
MSSNIDRFENIRNAYDILEVLPTASQSEIKKAYRAKARATHPDRNPPNEKDAWEKRFQEVQEAYEILSNPQTRKEYDKYLDSKKADENAQYENLWDKGIPGQDDTKTEIARKKWYDDIKLQKEYAPNFKKEDSVGTRKRRIWIYAFA